MDAQAKSGVWISDCRRLSRRRGTSLSSSLEFLHFVHLAAVSAYCVKSVEFVECRICRILSNVEFVEFCRMSNLSNFVEFSMPSSAMFSLAAQFRNSPVERATFLRLLTSVFCLLTFSFGFRVRYTFPRTSFTGGAGCRVNAFGRRGRVSAIGRRGRIRFGGRVSRFPAG
jgi:hypothetical protein